MPEPRPRSERRWPSQFLRRRSAARHAKTPPRRHRRRRKPSGCREAPKHAPATADVERVAAEERPSRRAPDLTASRRAAQHELPGEASTEPRDRQAPAQRAVPPAAAVEPGHHRHHRQPAPAPTPRRRRQSRRALAIGPQRLSRKGEPHRSARPTTCTIEHLIKGLFSRLLSELCQQVLLQRLPRAGGSLTKNSVHVRGNILDLDTWHDAHSSAKIAPIHEF
jgi:hypothetical protein